MLVDVVGGCVALGVAAWRVVGTWKEDVFADTLFATWDNWLTPVTELIAPLDEFSRTTNVDDPVTTSAAISVLIRAL